MSLQPVIPLAGLATYSDILMLWISGGANNATINLYANDYWPDFTTSLDNFEPTTNAGLGPQPLPTATRVGLDVVGRFDWTFPNVIFTIAAGPYPANVWGYWVQCADPYTGEIGLLWAQRFPTGYSFNTLGSSLPVNVFQSFGVCPPSAGPYTQLPRPIPDSRVRHGVQLWPPK